MFSTSSKNFKNCAGQIKQTCKLYAVHDLWVCVLCSKMRTSCFCLFWSIEVRLGIPHQQAKGYTRNTFPSPAISQMLWVENGKPGTESQWSQAPWLVGEAHQRPPPNPPPTPWLPASRFLAPGSSSLLAEDGTTDGDRDVSQSRLPDFKSLIFPLGLPNLAKCHSSCSVSKWS